MEKKQEPHESRGLVQQREDKFPATNLPHVLAPSQETNEVTGGKQIRMPVNAVHADYTSQGLTYKPHYNQHGNECRYVELTSNTVQADFASQGWKCNSRFRHSGSECWPVVPSN